MHILYQQLKYMFLQHFKAEVGEETSDHSKGQGKFYLLDLTSESILIMKYFSFQMYNYKIKMSF